MPVVWFLVMTACNNCGHDAGIFPGFQANYTKTYVQMPSQDACLDAQKRNSGSECWARPATDNEKINSRYEK
jgi:hypothetical protein